MWCLLCKNQRIFLPQAPAPESIIILGKTDLSILGTAGSFSWICFPLYIGCKNYWGQMHILPVVNICNVRACVNFVCEPHSYFLLSFSIFIFLLLWWSHLWSLIYRSLSVTLNSFLNKIGYTRVVISPLYSTHSLYGERKPVLPPVDSK